MTDAEVETRIRGLLASLLGGPVPPTGDLRREDLPAWDSLKHVDLIFLLEDEFEVVFSEEDMAEANSLSRLVEMVGRRAA